MPSRVVSRRSIVRSAAVAGVGAIAGCSVSVGTTDLTIRNCTETARQVRVVITAVETDESIYNARHGVPGESCVDVQDPPVAVKDLIDTAGSYAVRATADGFDAVTNRYDFSEPVVSNDDDAIDVTVTDDGLSVN